MRACAGNGGERRAGNGNSQAAQKEHQHQPMQHRQHRDVVHHREKRKQQQFGEQKKKSVRGELGQKDGERVANREPQRAQGVVVFARAESKAAASAKRQRETPAKAAREPKRRDSSDVGSNVKLNSTMHDQNEDNRGGQQFPRTKLGAKFFAEQDGRVGEQAHSSVGKVRMERNVAPVRVSATTSPRPGEWRACRGTRSPIRRAGSSESCSRNREAAESSPRAKRRPADRGRWLARRAEERQAHAASARAIATRWRIPRENVRTREPRRSDKPTSCNKSLNTILGLSYFLKPRKEQKIFFGGQFVVDHRGVSDETRANRVRFAVARLAGKTQRAATMAAPIVRRCAKGWSCRSRCVQQKLRILPARSERHSAQGEESSITLVDIFKTETNGRKCRRRHR